MHGIYDPAGITEGRDEETHTFLEGYVDPLAHAIFVALDRFLDDRVEANGLVREGSNLPQARTEFPAVHVGQ